MQIIGISALPNQHDFPTFQRLMNGETVEKPVLQILGQKKIAGGSGADRYRLLMSDGNYSHSCKFNYMSVGAF